MYNVVHPRAAACSDGRIAIYVVEASDYSDFPSLAWCAVCSKMPQFLGGGGKRGEIGRGRNQCARWHDWGEYFREEKERERREREREREMEKMLLVLLSLRAFCWLLHGRGEREDEGGRGRRRGEGEFARKRYLCPKHTTASQAPWSSSRLNFLRETAATKMPPTCIWL